MTHYLSADLFDVLGRLARKHEIQEIKLLMRDSLSQVLSQERRFISRYYMNQEGAE